MIDHDTSLLHQLAKQSKNRTANLMEVLRQYSRNLDDIKDILKADDKYGQSILHRLAFHKESHQTLLEILNEFFPENDLKQKEEILMHRNGKGDTILNVLSKEAKTEKSLKNLKQLILLYTETGLKPKLEAQKNPLKETITTGNTKAAKVLIDNDYSLFFDEKDGLNALHSCIRYGNSDLVTYILEKEEIKGVNSNLQLLRKLDRKKNTLLNFAVNLNWPPVGRSDQENDQGPNNTKHHKSTRMEILRSLMIDCWSDVDTQNETDDNCLHIAILNDFPEGAKLIIDYLRKLSIKEKAKGKRDRVKGDDLLNLMEKEKMTQC